MTVPMVSLIHLVHSGPFRKLLNKINRVETPTRAPADSYNLLAFLYAISYSSTLARSATAGTHNWVLTVSSTSIAMPDAACPSFAICRIPICFM